MRRNLRQTNENRGIRGRPYRAWHQQADEGATEHRVHPGRGRGRRAADRHGAPVHERAERGDDRRGLSPVQEGIVVATKGGFGGAGRGRPGVLGGEIEETLRRLKARTITLYYLHRVDPETPLEESLGAIKEYRDRGVIKYAGVSEVTVEQVERARKVVPIVAVQNQYNLAERKYDAVVDYCEREGIVFVPFFPLRGGENATLREMARKHKVKPEQITLAWLLRRSPAMLPIPGTLSIEHLKENLAAA